MTSIAAKPGCTSARVPPSRPRPCAGLAGQPGADASAAQSSAAVCRRCSTLGEANAIAGNPVEGVKRLKAASLESEMPAIGDHQARSASGTGWLDLARLARSRHVGNSRRRRRAGQFSSREAWKPLPTCNRWFSPYPLGPSWTIFWRAPYGAQTKKNPIAGVSIMFWRKRCPPY